MRVTLERRLGKRLRAARESAGYSPERAALALDRSYRVISDWERGLRTPSLTQVITLAGLYGVRPSDLIDT